MKPYLFLLLTFISLEALASGNTKFSIVTMCQNGRWQDANGTIIMHNAKGYGYLDFDNGGAESIYWITDIGVGELDLNATSDSWRMRTWIKEYRTYVRATVTLRQIDSVKYSFKIVSDESRLNLEFEANKVIPSNKVNSNNQSTIEKEDNRGMIVAIGTLVAILIVGGFVAYKKYGKKFDERNQ